MDKEIIAFLNTHGGTIYIGVDDNGNVIGIPQKLIKMIMMKRYLQF